MHLCKCLKEYLQGTVERCFLKAISNNHVCAKALFLGENILFAEAGKMAPEMNTEKQEAEGSTSAPRLQLSGEPCFAEGHRRTSKPTLACSWCS